MSYRNITLWHICTEWTLVIKTILSSDVCIQAPWMKVTECVAGRKLWSFIVMFPFSLCSMGDVMPCNIANRMMDNTTNFSFSTRKGQWQRSASKAPDIQVYLLCQALLLEQKITKNNVDFCKFHSISKFSHCSSLTFIRTHGNSKDRKTEEEEGWKFLHSTRVISPQIIEGLIRERDESVYCMTGISCAS